MKIKLLFLAIIFFNCTPEGVSQSTQRNLDSDIEYQNDRGITYQLESSIKDVLKEGNMLNPEIGQKQLEEVIDKRIAVSLPQPNETVLSQEEVYEKAKQATVIFGSAYNCGKCDKEHVNAASGYIIDASGICVTNYHVMEGYTSSRAGQSLAMVVRLADGRIFPVVEIIASSKANDLAVVRLDLKGETVPALALGHAAKVGSKVYVLSHPNQMFYYFSEGMVSRNYMHTRRKEGESGKIHQMAITADYAAGSSGGPVIDAYGNLVGTVSSTRSIYYDMEEQTNLQMVVKNTIPVIALRQLLQQ